MSSNDTLPRPSPSPTPSKLPRFLQKQAARDRSRSVADSQSQASSSSFAGSSPGHSPSPEPHSHQAQIQQTPAKPRKGSKFLSITKERKHASSSSSSTPSSSIPPVPSAASSSAVPSSIQSVDPHDPLPDSALDDPPIIIEPPNSYPSPSSAAPPSTYSPSFSTSASPPQPVPIPSPRSRTRSERPAASAPESQHMSSLYASTSSTGSRGGGGGGNRIGDIPTRLSGWFAQTFSTSSTDLSLPTIISQHSNANANANANSSTDSPRKTLGSGAGAAALLAAAKLGNKAMRLILDSDAVPDRCADPIWLLGVVHPGWEASFSSSNPPSSNPPSAFAANGLSSSVAGDYGAGGGGGGGAMTDPGMSVGRYTFKKDKSGGRGRAGSWRSSSSSVASSSEAHSALSSSPGSAHAQSLSGHGGGERGLGPGQGERGASSAGNAGQWPPAFHLDFTSRIWLTYRSHFGTPIRDGRLADLEACGGAGVDRMYSSALSSSSMGYASSMGYSSATYTGSGGYSRGGSGYGQGGGGYSQSGSETGHGKGASEGGGGKTSRKPWKWGNDTWTQDTGWGCMLRTGQSLLANALVEVHLGRDWRRPLHPTPSASYATYVKILTWFLDTPAPAAPFSVHRMALAGKELGTDVGHWFGPSVAAGAVRTLANAFPECGLSVALATDSTLYQSEVFAASHGDTDSSRSPRRQRATTWGERPVLLLVGVRLGIEGVNPIYYETIKMLYTFPQSVGIAGGRPSSSYYFVGSQADNLFYLDPHHTRPAIPLRPPPPAVQQQVYERTQMRLIEEQQERERRVKAQQAMGQQTRHHGRRERHRSVVDEEEEDWEVEELEEKEREPKKEQQHVRTRRRASTTNAHGAGYGYGNRGVHTPPPPGSPASVRTAASGSVASHASSSHAPASPSPLQQQFSSSSAGSAGSGSWASGSGDGYGYVDSPGGERRGGNGWESNSNRDSVIVRGEEGDEVRSPPPSYLQHGLHRIVDAADYNRQEPPVPPQEELDPMQLHYCNAYSAAELKTFHCERVRKMPLSSLDPSMLIGFLCRDEKDWWDFKRRVAELPKTIFSIENEPPTWPSDSDDNMGLESISEPDDFDIDEEEDAVEVDAHVDVDEDEEDGEPEQFFDTRSSSSPASDGDGDDGDNELVLPREHHYHHAHRHSTDTSEEDPADPITPGPTSRFDLGRRARGAEGTHGKGREFTEGGGLKFDDEEGDDIEDDWVDPSMPTPTDAPRMQPQPRVPPPPPAPVAFAKSTASSTSSAAPSASASASRHSSSTGRTKKGKRQTPVPVPSVRIPQQQEQMHYPFPVTPAEDSPPPGQTAFGDRARNVSAGRKTHRMHTARARDGGRTQSGGVKGILTED